MATFIVCRPLRISVAATASLDADTNYVIGTPAATAFTLTGPTTGTSGIAAIFTVTPNGSVTSSTVVTPAATNGGIVVPPTLTFAAASTTAQTFTVTRASGGTSSVSITNNGGLANLGSPISFTTGGLGPIDALTINTESATPEQIGVWLVPTRVIAAGSTVTMRYKLSSAPSFTNAHPLLRIQPAGNESGPTTLVDSFAGSVFDLTPGLQYDVELTHVESGQPDKATTIQRTTRSLPAAAGTVNRTANSVATIGTQFAAVNPGDVLEIAVGTYDVSSLTLSRSGTVGSPIYIRGASRTGTVIRDTTGQVLTITASHLVIENLTITGSSVDSGTAAASGGISISGPRTNVTVRNMNMLGVDTGITCQTGQSTELTGALVYGCDLRGNNPWSQASNGNATWNDTGVELAGFGNCAFQNTMQGFGDSFAFNTTQGDGLRSEGNYAYRNRLLNTGDDGIEFDYCTRNIAFYDNMVTNCGSLMSASPFFGGPGYCFRNTCVNTIRTPYKINGQGIGVTGFVVYNNTVVRTDGQTSGWGMISPAPDGAWQNYSFRNNLLVYRGSASGGLLALEPADHNPSDFDYNAWFPAGASDDVWWTNAGGTFASLAAARSGLPAVTLVFGAGQRHAHDVATVTNPFVNAITLGASHTTEFIATPDATLSASGPKNLGIAIPGITDGFSGAAPDVGSFVAGRSQPSYGVTPAWVSAMPLFTWTRLTNTAPTVAGSQINSPDHLDGITAFSGSAYDPTRRYFMFNGGGHGDGSGNGVFAVRVGRDTADVIALKADSLTTQGDVAYYPDGTPSAAHTYGTLIYVPAFDSLMRFGNTATFGTGNSKFGTVDRFNLTTNVWSAAGTYTSLPSGAADFEMHTCVDPTTSDVYETTWGTSSVRKWAFGTPGSWSVIAASSGNFTGDSLVFDPGNVSTGRTARVVYMGTNPSWMTLAGVRTTFSFTGLSGGGAAWVYCPSRDTYIGGFRSGASALGIRECNPSTFNVTAMTVSGTSPIVGTPGTGWATIRLQIDDTLGIVMAHSNFGSNDLFAFRYR